MELKKYQKNILRDLQDYLDCVDDEQDFINAWSVYCRDKNFDAPPYKNKIAGVPNVCLKVPTGGGKTFLACAALKKIFRGTGRDKNKFVVWLVPSDAILTQTVAALSNENHPYRQRLDKDFGNHVEVFTKDMLLAAQNFSPSIVAENLCVCVLSYATLRIDSKKKDVRKVYQENGGLKIFDAVEKDFDAPLKDTPDNALIQIVRKYNPVVVVDESHNANSKLSVEMLEVVNPAFVLELTATPRTTSNIISFADARELKREHMVKLPVLAKNCQTVGEVMTMAIRTRNFLEDAARHGEYVRPIVLFQAQPKNDSDSETFAKVKEKLLGMGIPAAQIAIKTSNVNELNGINLMSKACPIRYIITVNALKEGWDCPFAYVLASLANKTSRVDVEQIVGRILRQPYTRRHMADVLNVSFVYTCSQNFFETLDAIVAGLNNAGFSQKASRLVEELEKNFAVSKQLSLFENPSPVTEKTFDNAPTATDENISVDETNATDENISGDETNATVENISVNAPISADEKFSGDTSTSSAHEDFVTEQDAQFSPPQPIDELSKKFRDVVEVETRIPMQEQFVASARELKIPQFLEKISSGLFGESSKLLERENLSSGFKLSRQDAQINFALNTDDLYKIDLQEQGEALPRYFKFSRAERDDFNQWLKTFPPERKLRICAETLATEINRNDRYSFNDVRDYVRRVLDDTTAEELEKISLQPQLYATIIRKRIEELEKNYRRENFRNRLAGGQIFCEDSYTLPDAVASPRQTVSIPKSLYEVEGGMNNFERRTIDALANLDNVLWWHRNLDRQEFRLNGWLNHYPDFILQTRSGHVVLVETKGEYLANDDSREKLSLGREWKSLAGAKYRYFMVFDSAAPIENSFSLNEFLNVMQSL